MRFKAGSYRRGYETFAATAAWTEFKDVLEEVSIQLVDHQRAKRQIKHEESAARRGGLPALAGVQSGIKSALRKGLDDKGWRQSVLVRPANDEASNSLLTIDHHKFFENEQIGVGVEVTFDNRNFLTGPLVRLTVANTAHPSSPLARVDIGVVVLPTEALKGNELDPPRMDSTIGSYEELRALLPHVRSIFPVPLIVCGMEWADGGLSGPPERLGE